MGVRMMTRLAGRFTPEDNVDVATSTFRAPWRKAPSTMSRLSNVKPTQNYNSGLLTSEEIDFFAFNTTFLKHIIIIKYWGCNQLKSVPMASPELFIQDFHPGVLIGSRGFTVGHNGKSINLSDKKGIPTLWMIKCLRAPEKEHLLFVSNNFWFNFKLIETY